jgi:hypothetical protein
VKNKGIKIFAWLLIILNIFIFLLSLNFKSYFDCLRSFHKNFIIGVISYSILSSVAGIIVGLGLLRLKNVMRKIGIGINSLDLLLGILLFFISLSDVRQYSYTIAVSELAKRPIRTDVYTLANIIFYITVFANWIVLAINLLFVVFFTRPGVKQQFK